MLLFQEEASAQVHWLAMTRKLNFGEQYRVEVRGRDFAE